jgi:cytochrome c-type biogenesis protein CcmH/NrfG
MCCSGSGLVTLSGRTANEQGFGRGKEMTNPSLEPESAGPGLCSAQVYVMAAICLLLGVALGYLFRGSGPGTTAAAVRTETAAASPQASPTPKMPSLDEMKQMAVKKAEPLIEQLKTDPNNIDLLKQIAKIYVSTHQFKEAADYYQKIVDIHPNDIATRNDVSSCLFYSGDMDGAISQLQASLKIDPKDANSLFNLGMIRLRGKNDSQGALAAWRQLLKSNPKLDDNKKAEVEKLIATASHQNLPTQNAQ